MTAGPPASVGGPDLLREHEVRQPTTPLSSARWTAGRPCGRAPRASTSPTCRPQDASCTTRNNSVVFSVEPTKTQQYIARAFFPSTPKNGRNILVNARSLQTSGSWTPTNILGHELGHVLGFRHEHTRPEAGTCFEDNNWRALTPYDSASIMHYPQCNGTSSNLSMTNTDRQGVAALYGP